MLSEIEITATTTRKPAIAKYASEKVTRRLGTIPQGGLLAYKLRSRYIRRRRLASRGLAMVGGGAQH